MKSTLKIALAGNPNSGKSSLFNSLTGLRQKVGNFAGVTVEKKTGMCSLPGNRQAEIIDLPGTYSLYPRRIDEHITFDVVLNKDNDSKPDVIVIVADASNLKRNLLFCTQIIDLNLPVIIALNMLDVAEKNGMLIHTTELSRQLGVPVIPINARTGKGITQLKTALVSEVGKPTKTFVDFDAMAPAVVSSIKTLLPLPSSYAAFLLASLYKQLSGLTDVQLKNIETALSGIQFSTARIQAEEIVKRYSLIEKMISLCVSEKSQQQSLTESTRKLDQVLLHPLWGFLIFLSVFFLVFQAVFSWAQYPMDWLDAGISWLQDFLHQALPSGFLTNLLVEGILAGIGGIVVFIPQIMLLFAFVSILEDTGYMARVSFMLDNVMRRFGLSGKSTIPLVSGMACAVPAIMSTRNIDNWKDRMITIMVTPLMSCSARLPVYTLLVGFIVPDEKLWGILGFKGLAMLGLYLLGWIMAFLSGLILKIFVRSKEKSFYMMEMPLYRWPRWGNVCITMIEKAKVFVVDAGKIIIAISIVLWLLASFGPGNSMREIEERYARMEKQSETDPEDLKSKLQSEKLSASYAGIIGRAMEPAISPLGFDWKIGIALLTSFAAREVFVGTMTTIYSIGEEGGSGFEALRTKLSNEVDPETGEKIFTSATAFSLMIFFAFAMQCMSTVAIVKRETRSWKWPLLQVVYLTGLAYLSSLLVYQLLK